MPEVKFYRGEYKDLKKVPLSDGSIYFAQDTRRLFIDTPTVRLPVAGDVISGKIFWVCLQANQWNSETPNTQTVHQYYEEKGDEATVAKMAIGAPIAVDDPNPPIQLNELLTNESIIFVGHSTYGTPDADGVYPAIVSTMSTADSITFSLFQIPNKDITKPTNDIWIQLYCPNPQLQSFEKVDSFNTVYTTRIYLESDNWLPYNGQKKNAILYDVGGDDEANKYYQDIHIPNIVFSEMPYMLNLSDDSLENRKEYLEIEFQEFECTEHVSKKDTIRFLYKEKPKFNIAVDLCIVIANGNQTKSNDDKTINQWIKVTVGQNGNLTQASEGYYTEVSCNPLASIPEGQEREFLVFCTDDTNKGYSQVKNITYSDNGGSPKVKFTFKTGITQNAQNFDCFIIQLNNLATLYKDVTLKGGTRTIDFSETEDGWYPDEREIDEGKHKKYYWQVWPDPDSETRLTLKHLPLIYPKDQANATDFAKIVETKIFNNQIQFWSTEPIEKDLKIVVVDWV